MLFRKFELKGEKRKQGRILVVEEKRKSKSQKGGEVHKHRYQNYQENDSHKETATFAQRE